jgi:hypothetical protein
VEDVIDLKYTASPLVLESVLVQDLLNEVVLDIALRRTASGTAVHVDMNDLPELSIIASVDPIPWWKGQGDMIAVVKILAMKIGQGLTRLERIDMRPILVGMGRIRKRILTQRPNRWTRWRRSQAVIIMVVVSVIPWRTIRLCKPRSMKEPLLQMLSSRVPPGHRSAPLYLVQSHSKNP